ncbi:NAD(P)H-dependent oxidoreductase [Spirosoma sp. KCTC 42546]|uniref:NADPH-dependent FMN reductase n=1 Tax=Spirosoma sp. KCTC 42546 TaxID=2520506 RepID=UPI00115B1B71|nr:NADPH-dependent FMN reductase [Spirosoma sp. KCTC 42546]QDK81483.1 NAD(P)H-dependent oxidoreductase [Spirosoma sp. KCTC 42546]
MHILAISGSLRAASTNTSILRAVAELAPPTVTVTLYNGLDNLPHFSPERDIDPAPEAVATLRNQLREADAVIICTPEYIHGMPGVLKNMLDWIASSGEFVYKPVGVISAGPSDTGGSRAHIALVHTMDVLTANLPEKASLSIPFVRTKLDVTGQVTDSILTQELRDVIDTLIEAVQNRSTIA